MRVYWTIFDMYRHLSFQLVIHGEVKKLLQVFLKFSAWHFLYIMHGSNVFILTEGSCILIYLYSHTDPPPHFVQVQTAGQKKTKVSTFLFQSHLWGIQHRKTQAIRHWNIYTASIKQETLSSQNNFNLCYPLN